MRRLRATLGVGFGTLLLLAALTGCGTKDQEASRSLVVAATPATGPAATATTSRPGLGGGPPASPILPRPSGSPQLPFPSGSRPSDAPSLPIPSRSPLTTPGTGALAPASDGNCPATHPIKATQIGPVKTYLLSDNAAYSHT